MVGDQRSPLLEGGSTAIELARLREEDNDIGAGSKAGEGDVAFPTNGSAARDAVGAGAGGVGDNDGLGDVVVGDNDGSYDDNARCSVRFCGVVESNATGAGAGGFGSIVDKGVAGVVACDDGGCFCGGVRSKAGSGGDEGGCFAGVVAVSMVVFEAR